MAIETAIGGSGEFFVGEDKRMLLGNVYTSDAKTVCVDLTTLPPIHLVIRKADGTADPAIIDRELDGITGTFSATPSANLQKGYVDLTDDETNLLKFSAVRNPMYRYSWKAMTFPETVLAYGDLNPQLATAR